MKKILIENKENNLVGLLFSNKKKKKPDFFLFHGGGQSNKDRTSYISKELLKKDISSLAFDFSGSGESPGKTENSSLAKRINEARTVIEKYKSKNINLCGSSMGAYIAISLLPYYKNIQNLFLFCPGVYDKKAKNINFGSKFSKIIRQKNSWKNSDAYKILKKYKGNLIIFIGEEDMVIPKDVISLIDKNSKKCICKEIIWIPKCPHKVHKYIPKNKKIKKLVIDKIIKYLDEKK